MASSWMLDLAYLAALLAFSPLLLYARVFRGKYREGFAAKFLGRVPLPPKATAPRLWVHAVSVGEVNLVAPLLKEWRSRHDGWEIVLSTTTKTGFDLATKKHGGDCHVTYAPLDFSWAVKTAIRRIRPDMLLLAELELWPNLIRAAKTHAAAVAVFNGRLGEGSFRGYRRVKWLVGPTLRRIDVIAAQTPEYAQRFLALGAPADRVHVTGNVKFDGALSQQQSDRSHELRAWAGIDDDETVFLAGSTQAPEEAMAIQSYRELAGGFPRLRLVLVPRHPERFGEVAGLLERSGLPYVRRTGGSPQRRERPIILVDTIGELSAWWALTNIGFVGGSLGSRGGQNMIEPAACGVATCFGPNTKNFRDVVRLLLDADAAKVVTDGDALTAFVRQCLRDGAFAAELGERAKRVVDTQQGATARTVDLLGPR